MFSFLTLAMRYVLFLLSVYWKFCFLVVSWSDCSLPLAGSWPAPIQSFYLHRRMTEITVMRKLCNRPVRLCHRRTRCWTSVLGIILKYRFKKIITKAKSGWALSWMGARKGILPIEKKNCQITRCHFDNCEASTVQYCLSVVKSVWSCTNCVLVILNVNEDDDDLG